MKKALMLAVTYVIASFLGALAGAMLWADPFRMSDVTGFMIMG
jgi:hypothetical protein